MSLSTLHNSPRFNVVLMGLVFLFVFTAYSTIQVYASKLYSPDLSSNMLSTLYGVFTIMSFVAPGIVNKIGTRMAMMLGTLGYACLVVVGLIYFEENYADWLVIVGGGLCGLGAALLWTAQGRLILQYSTDENRGVNFGIFWGIFQAAAVIGGFLSWFYFASLGNDTGSSVLYIIFLAMVIIGGFCNFLLKAPSALKTDKVDPEHIAALDREFSELSWSAEAAATFRMFTRKEMLIMAPMFFYTGFNQPYQLNVFTRFFTSTSLGMEVVVFYLAEIIGGLGIGYVLDNICPSKRRHVLIWGQYILGLLGFALAVYHEYDYAWNKPTPTYEIQDSEIALPSVVFAIWGFSDSAVQCYAYYLMGNLYFSGKLQARAIGFYKFIQSLGWTIAFVLTPADRAAPMTQLLLVFALFVISFPLGYVVAPRDEINPKFAIEIGEDESRNVLPGAGSGAINAEKGVVYLGEQESYQVNAEKKETA
eukprot:Nk52_evm63s1401 gene=Nk52_evmTU63s1401